MRRGFVYVKNLKAGEIYESDEGYHFRYDQKYLSDENNDPVSLTMPLKEEEFYSENLFPFFDGLIPEGWLLDLSLRNWKLRHQDRFGLLLESCHDAIGSVSVKKTRKVDHA